MLNIWIGTGRVVRDATLAKTKTDKSICVFSIAVKRDRGEETDFVDVVTWDRLAEFCAKQLRKGKLATVIGALQARDYEDRDGNKRRAWEINAQKVQITDFEDDE